MRDYSRLRQAIDDRVTIEPNSGCWLWTGHLNAAGYGILFLEKRPQRAHRANNV